MAQNNHSRNHTSSMKSNTYVYGNAVRKLAVAEPITKPVTRPGRDLEQERQEQRQHQKEIQRANKINFLYTIAVVSVLAFIFVVCVQYLRLQADVKSDATEVAQLEAQLSELMVSNDEAEVEINGNIDYDAILDTAINELGMVYPNKKQVIEYNSGESEYVKQYKDIPAAK